ncbi:hypothetical protein AFE_2039 [Acidithiobacillus ferrooxidans ATCC 23270]|uniref:Uncharacterized protein n=1 Tax=Acidithiobacillus ferrooxidans (strain ATCC 23270 / DSM 14882 / CIP 104768 / NCIMB 8455) TaxID=243159 RepID=B7J4Q0_ACIF2|nr:hypothetical protein AFE_2039 [Acidithiobacillus ferrooxidans ATCC 23270]
MFQRVVSGAFLPIFFRRSTVWLFFSNAFWAVAGSSILDKDYVFHFLLLIIA